MLRTSLSSKFFPKNFYCSRFHSYQSIKQQQNKETTNESSVDKSFDNEDSQKSTNDLSNQTQDFLQRLKSKPKELKNKPFIKNLFCGNYLYEYLKFPEYEHNYLLEVLNNNYVEPVKSYFKNTDYNKIINNNGNLTLDALNKLRTLNLYSKSIPTEYDGVGLDSIGVARMLEETGIYPGLGIGLIFNNELAAKSIVIYGNTDQKIKYLKRIARGELKASFCYSELDNGVDVSKFNVNARLIKRDLDNKKETFVINGNKTWVSILSTDTIDNDDVVFVVIAKTLEIYENTEESKSLNAFLIDKNTPGVSIKKMLNNNNGINLYEIQFKDVKVTSDDLLGKSGDGFEISSKIIENSRYLIGALCVGLLKNLYKETIDFALNERRFGKSLYEYPIIKYKIANIETRLYTMESMIYLTAGIIDSYQTSDVGCESALTKIYCTETLKSCVNDCLEIMAMGEFTKLDKVKKKYLLDLNYLTNTLNTNDLLRLYVATNGLILAGVEFGQELIKVRNPLKYPGFVIRQILINHRLVKSAQKKVPEYFYLWEHVHPTLNVPVSILEQSAVKFMMAVKSSIINHGRDVIDFQTSLIGLSDICMHLYAMNSVLARASRSYSIGLPSGQHEVALAYSQSDASGKIIDELHGEIIKSRGGEGIQGTKLNIADRVFKFKDHAASHSISRNY